MKTKHLTVYARRENTTELPHANPREIVLKDVQVYSDRKCKKPKARFMWYMSSKPTRRNKFVTINCYRWRLIWLRDK